MSANMSSSTISVVPATAHEAPETIEDAEIYEGGARPLGSIAKPRALPTERYRMIALRIDALLGVRGPKVIVVTSPSRGDGKTTTAMHLAATCARDLGRRVCLIDGDLARPRLHRPLGLEVQRGLGDVLRGEARVEDVMWRIGDDPMYVIPGTPAPHDGFTPFAALPDVIAAARARHDVVIIDTPATTESADAAALARWADGVVLVIRSGATTRDALAGALEALCDAPLLGCVLNDHDGPIATARTLRVPAPHRLLQLAGRPEVAE